MKKMISFLLAMILLCSGISVGAETLFVNAVYDEQTNTLMITLNGAPNGAEVSIIVCQYDMNTLDDYTDLTEENIGNHVIYSVDTVWEGVPLMIPLDSPSKGHYAVYAGCFGKTPGQAKFYIATPQDYQDAYVAFDSATVGTIAGVIQQYCINEPIVALDVANPVYLQNTSDVEKMLIDNLSTVATVDAASINDSFQKALLVAEFNTATDKAAVVEKYSSYITLQDMDFYRSNQTAVCELMILQSDAVNGKLLSLSQFYTSYQKAIALTKLNQSSRDKVQACLLANAAVFGIDATGGYARANASQVNIAMAFKEFQTTEAAQAAFNTAVATYPLSVVPSVGGGGGGGGISAGGTGGRGSLATSFVSPQQNVPQAVFSDIGGYSWAVGAITVLKEKGILSGTGNGTFEPARAVKREEFAKIMAEGFSISKKDVEYTFSDVSEDAWYAPYIAAVSNASIVNGMGDGSFGVGMSLTREDACVILYRYLKGIGFDFTARRENVHFSDEAAISTYAEEAVDALYTCGIINGKDNNVFEPKTNITRAETAILVYHVLEERGMVQ